MSGRHLLLTDWLDLPILVIEKIREIEEISLTSSSPDTEMENQDNG